MTEALYIFEPGVHGLIVIFLSKQTQGMSFKSIPKFQTNISVMFVNQSANIDKQAAIPLLNNNIRAFA